MTIDAWTGLPKTAKQIAADAKVSHGDALAYAAEGHILDAQRSADECRARVNQCGLAAISEGTAEAWEHAASAALLVDSLPRNAEAQS